MENNVINTNKGIKSFFENNWLSLLLIVGVAVASFFIYERINQIDKANSVMSTLIKEQNTAIIANHETIDNLNKTVNDEREAREALRNDYERRMEEIRSDLQTQIDRIRRNRGARTTELVNNPSELVNSYNRTFGFGRSTP
ncbi:DUF2570 domain-containing protein [bacterium]|nr:DUF2570 domain-containing protein [Candidatus Elulimicrobium humile]